MNDLGLFFTWHVELWAASLAYILAAIVYAVLAPWNRSTTGRRLMFAVLSTGISLGMVALYTLHAYGDPQLELVIIYGMFALSGLGLAATFFREQVKAHHIAQPAKKTRSISMSGQLAYYAKAVTGGLIAGGSYFMSVLAPQASIADVTLLQWIGFVVAVLGTSFGVGAMTNGPKPVKNEPVAVAPVEENPVSTET